MFCFSSQNGTTCHSQLVGCLSAFCWNSSTPSVRSLRFASSRPPEPVAQRCREIRACFPIVLCIWKMKASQGCPEIDRVEGRLAYDGLGRDVASTADEATRVEPRGQINETRPISVTTALAPGNITRQITRRLVPSERLIFRTLIALAQSVSTLWTTSMTKANWQLRFPLT